jgi:adenine deaminase
LQDFKVISTYIDGNLVASKGASLIPDIKAEKVNNFNAKAIKAEDLNLEIPNDAKFIKTIKVNDGQLITDSFLFELTQRDAAFLTENDILKLVVYNRYKDSKPTVAFINGFGLKNGAIASSVAHDSHNIIAVGTSDVDIAEAINLIVREKGGISVVADKKMGVLPLPIAGLMSDKDGYEVAKDYTQIDEFTKSQLNCPLKSPFMSLSFMALLVIPSLKLSDKGLFDGNTFKFTDIFE